MNKLAFVLVSLTCIQSGCFLRIPPEFMLKSQYGISSRTSFEQAGWAGRIGRPTTKSNLKALDKIAMLLLTANSAVAFSLLGHRAFSIMMSVSRAQGEVSAMVHARHEMLRCAAPLCLTKSTAQAEYLQVLQEKLEENGGSCPIEELRGFWKKRKKKAFPGMSLKQVLQTYPEQFRLDALKDATSYMVYRISQKIKPTDMSSIDKGVKVSQSTEARASSNLWTLGLYELVVVDTEETLGAVLKRPPFGSPDLEHAVAIDCEGIREGLDLIQVATAEPRVYVFDCVKLSARRVCSALQPLLETDKCLKLVHDVHGDAHAMKIHGQLDKLRGLLDTQLVAEHTWGEICMGFNDLLQKLGQGLHPGKQSMRTRMNSGAPSIWSKRPLPKADIEYAALDATLLLDALPRLHDCVGQDLKLLVDASVKRAEGAVTNNASRAIGFDIANDYRLTSAELLLSTRPGDAFRFEPLVLQVEAADLIQLLPEDFRGKLVPLPSPPSALAYKDLMDINLDVGRPPVCWNGSARILLCNDGRKVTSKDIEFIGQKLGKFGPDRRATLDGKLHRISAMMDREGIVYGLTMRVGRSVRGNADMILDILLGSCKSVLVVGEPGSGKTTIIREIARVLSEKSNVIIIDTSNEIAGDGHVPHSCVGEARRMMVQSLDKQFAVMTECVQNHSPQVMVIDEIGRTTEVKAARTVKQRGIRMIASAHGDLQRLIGNRELNGLVGGVEMVTVGDEMAQAEAKKHHMFSKIRAQRVGDPVFDVVIEVQHSNHNEWRVSTDVASSVDAILRGQKPKVQRRMRDPQTGAARFALL